MLNNAKLMNAVAVLQASLNRPGPARCMCCNSIKQSDGRWRVAGYQPHNPAHPPVAYVICGDCLDSKAKILKGARGIETMARDMAERKATV